MFKNKNKNKLDVVTITTYNFKSVAEQENSGSSHTASEEENNTPKRIPTPDDGIVRLDDCIKIVGFGEEQQVFGYEKAKDTLKHNISSDDIADFFQQEHQEEQQDTGFKPWNSAGDLPKTEALKNTPNGNSDPEATPSLNFSGTSSKLYITKKRIIGFENSTTEFLTQGNKPITASTSQEDYPTLPVFQKNAAHVDNFSKPTANHAEQVINRSNLRSPLMFE